MADADYGNDIGFSLDLDPLFLLASGPVIVAQALARRFETPRGSLFYDPEYGMDLREFLNESLADSDLLVIQTAVAAEARRDERVNSCSATVTLDRLSQTLTVKLALVLSTGPFTLVMTVDSASVKLAEVAQ